MIKRPAAEINAFQLTTRSNFVTFTSAQSYCNFSCFHAIISLERDTVVWDYFIFSTFIILAFGIIHI